MAIKISLGRTRHSGVDNGLDEGNQRHSSTVFRAGGGIAATPEDPHNDFQPVARAAPQDGPASGLSRAFRSDQTPPFPEVLASLFGHSLIRTSGQPCSTVYSVRLALGPLARYAA